MFEMFVVYDTELENVKAFFIAEGDANNFANPNGWGVAPVLVAVPFYVAVTPTE
jgi:hypothetical protein